MKAIKPVALFLAASMFIGAGQAWPQESGRPQDAPAKERSFGPLEKSLLIPGWGQFSERRYLEGALFLGAAAYCLVRAFRQNRWGNDAYARYKAALSQEDAVRFRTDTEKLDTRRNQFLLAGAAVWAVNLLDITLIVRGKKGSAKSLSLRIGHDETQAIVVVAGCRF